MSAVFPVSHLGRYRVLRELGRGAMGVVHEAEDESLHRKAAIKTLLLSDDPQERIEQEARFRQEAQAAAALNHPNVITIYELGREQDWLFIAMELLRGVELRDLMDRGGLDLRTAVELGVQVAAALAAAHAGGVVHRDIKPSNVMVLPGHRVKVMDFGIARTRSAGVKTQTGVLLGSPKYMSPEQVQGLPLDHRTDIFSLGSVLYEMVARVPPFSGNDLGALLSNIVHEEPPPPSTFDAAIPSAFDAAIMKALSKDPNARYQHASELQDALTACAASLPQAHQPYGAHGSEEGFDLLLVETTAPLTAQAAGATTIQTRAELTTPLDAVTAAGTVWYPLNEEVNPPHSVETFLRKAAEGSAPKNQRAAPRYWTAKLPYAIALGVAFAIALS